MRIVLALADVIFGLAISITWLYVFTKIKMGQMVWAESTVWIAEAEFYICIFLTIFYVAQLPYWFRLYWGNRG